jgi:hypothetical protein
MIPYQLPPYTGYHHWSEELMHYRWTSSLYLPNHDEYDFEVITGDKIELKAAALRQRVHYNSVWGWLESDYQFCHFRLSKLQSWGEATRLVLLGFDQKTRRVTRCWDIPMDATQEIFAFGKTRHPRIVWPGNILIRIDREGRCRPNKFEPFALEFAELVERYA